MTFELAMQRLTRDGYHTAVQAINKRIEAAHAEGVREGREACRVYLLEQIQFAEDRMAEGNRSDAAFAATMKVTEYIREYIRTTKEPS